jgi:tetratricopeptide (TPR) repeat protein/ABC-type iron transport system FetAB ATPase subunit
MPNATNAFKYNPGFANDEDLRSSFIVRRVDLKLILGIIDDNARSSNNRHVLLIGPRGSGKTTLTRRVAAEVRFDKALGDLWIPVTFGEESYSITTVGEFWLECIYHLQAATDSTELSKTYQNLRKIVDDQELTDGAIGAIVGYASNAKRRLLVVVENLNTLLEEQMNPDDGWSFRHALQNHPEIMLLATATSSFDQIERDEFALFEQFKIHTIGPLSTSDCRKLWKHVSGEDLSNEQARPIQILTGGNPRLIRVLAEFAVDNLLTDLLNKLSQLIDQYTDYFKSQLDLLPSLERKVFVALLELWDPATSRQVADVSRMDTNKAGAYLARLANRGAVVKVGSFWQASERLFNIYYLMRRRGAPSSRVQALVRFMTVYYAPDQLMKRVEDLAQQACTLQPGQRHDYYAALSDLVGQFEPDEQRRAILMFPSAFFDDPAIPAPIHQLRQDMGVEDMSSGKPDTQKVRRLKSHGQSERKRIFSLMASGELKKAEVAAERFVTASNNSVESLYILSLVKSSLLDHIGAEHLIRAAIEKDPKSGKLHRLLSSIMLDLKRYDEALVSAQIAVELTPESSLGWEMLGAAAARTEDMEKVAEQAFLKALSIDSDSLIALVSLAKIKNQVGNTKEADALLLRASKVSPPTLLGLGSYADHLAATNRNGAAERIYKKMKRVFPNEPRIWARLGIFASEDGREEEARKYLTKAVDLAENDARPWATIAHFHDRMGEVDEAREAWNRALDIDPNNARHWILMGEFSWKNDFYAEAERAFLKAIELDPSSDEAWNSLGVLLADLPDRHLEAENAFHQAIEKAPKSCSAIHSLGELFEQQGRFEEADKQFRNALSLPGSCTCALSSLLNNRNDYGRKLSDVDALIDTLLNTHQKSAQAHSLKGRYLHRGLHDIEGALTELLKSLAINSSLVPTWIEIALTYLSKSSTSKEAVDDLLERVVEYRPSPDTLNRAAWKIRSFGIPGSAEIAVALGQFAFNSSPQDWDARHTLAYALLDSGNFGEAISHLPSLLESYSEAEFSLLVDILIHFSKKADGKTDSIIEKLENSGRSLDFEPLIVALKIRSGENVNVAAEVLEVAHDIINQIDSNNSGTPDSYDA